MAKKKAPATNRAKKPKAPATNRTKKPKAPATNRTKKPKAPATNRTKKPKAKKHSPKLTPNQQAFAKQQKRIRNFIRAAEKRGYKFPAGSVPERPARVTKRDIERITALTPEVLYKAATYVFEGSVFSGTEGRMIERERTAAHVAETRRHKKDPRYHTQPGLPPAEATDVQERLKEFFKLVTDGEKEYNQAYSEATDWEPQRNWSNWFAGEKEKQVNRMLRMFAAAINNSGWHATMREIGLNATAFQSATQLIMYHSKSEQIDYSFNALAEILKGAALTAEESADLEILNDAQNGYQDETYEV